MQALTEIALDKAERGIFTREQAALWVGSHGARLDALLKRAAASREIWRIRRGYTASPTGTRGAESILSNWRSASTARAT